MKNTTLQAIARVLVFLSLFTTTTADELPDSLFENQIRPVLAETCFRCHGDTRVSGMLRVDSRDSLLTGGDSGPAIVPGNPQESLLIKAIQRHEDVSAMPPEKDKALRADQVAAFEAWIRAGAVWPEDNRKFESTKHWALQPVVDFSPPAVTDTAWSRNSVDAFIRARQESASATPAPQADKFMLMRRATFDLTGLPPTSAEVEAFKNDFSPDAFENVVNRLLASPHYGERWGRHWLDVVRYADTAGETADYPVPLAWRYRNYVIDAFNKDKPYDQFLREQIAGDILANQTPSDHYAEMVIATGYLAISRRFGFDSENYHHLTIQDTIDTLGQSVLGLSLGCARCHDHKFDAVTMEDYYGLYGIFDSSRYAFPGSEQKQKFRSMVPLLPPGEAVSKWRAFDREVATLAAKLEMQKQPVPAAVLRSLNDMDGDFEMQAPAAGGSNGVLVPPWLYEGKIAVTNAAQSPFRNLYARGRVGASLAADSSAYRIAQSLYPRHSAENCDRLFVNLDFRIGAADANPSGAHKFQIGAFPRSPAVIIHVLTDRIALQIGDLVEQVAPVSPNEWHNIQLTLDLHDRTISGIVTRDGSTDAAEATTSFSGKPFLANWPGMIDFAELASTENADHALPAIEFDNLGIQDEPIPSASTELSSEQADVDPSELSRQLTEIVGTGGNFEFQEAAAPPGSPWNPGPNSVVRITRQSQSPYQNVFPSGELGVHMPNRGEYDGFGLTLPRSWSVNDAEHMFACFDFQCADVAAGGDGTWRYYIGHGRGNSAAVELFFNGSQFFRRSADSRDAVCALSTGEWYQIQLKLNLKARTYEGTITSKLSLAAFTGEVSSGWDGIIDYSFIDSYGHIGGVRPGLNVDNYDISSTSFPAFDAPSTNSSSLELASRHERTVAIRNQLTAIQNATQESARKLNTLLAEGPFPMTYGMAEGTPHSVHIQLRGEPTQPGREVARGFVRSVGGKNLEMDSSGSGRLELAEWLTRSDNPLTARVMVNRIWQYHFGRGLVKTPNDFGVRGLAPTHPELLDHLAAQFVRNGWSIKSMHRLIMLSQTYQQSSLPASGDANTTAAADSEDLYTRFTRRRLSAEEIRDAILIVSGDLDREPGREHAFPSPIGWGFTQHGPFNAVYDHNKRSVYLMTQRLRRHPFLALFDGPDPNASTADRLETTVPTQALFFLNDPFLHSKADAWAGRLLADNGTETESIEAAYQTAFGRSASTTEQLDGTDYLKASREALSELKLTNIDRQTLASFLRTLLGSNEFLHVD